MQVCEYVDRIADIQELLLTKWPPVVMAVKPLFNAEKQIPHPALISNKAAENDHIFQLQYSSRIYSVGDFDILTS